MPNWQRNQWNLHKSQQRKPIRKTQEQEPTSQNEHNEGDQRRIAHIEHRPRQSTKADPCRPENERIHKYISPGHTCTHKCAPVPPVVLCTQQEIHQQDSGSRRGNNHQAVAEEQEPEHVVDLVGPEGGHNEVQLDKNGTEGENSGQQNRRNCAQATRHRRNLPRDLVGLGRTLKRLLERCG